jgi:hypothetical protein
LKACELPSGTILMYSTCGTISFDDILSNGRIPCHTPC